MLVGVGVGFQVKKSSFARNCMKYADMHRKIMFLIPPLLAWGQVPKMFCYELHEMCRYPQEINVSDLHPMEVSKIFLLGI